MAGVALPAFLLAVDVDLLAAHGLRLAFQVVELAQVSRRDAEDLRERFERVALLGDDVVHAVGDVDVVSLVGVDRHAEIVGIDPLFVYGRQGIHAASGLKAFHGLLGARAVARCVERFALRAVEQVELRLLDDAAQPLRIVGRGGVTGRLQSARPAAVVVGGVDEERVVARLRIQETGMILVRGFDRAVGAETFAAGVVVVEDAPSRPVVFALDAEMVVRRTRQCAVAAVGFQNALRQRDAGRNAVAFHVRHGDVLVAVDVLLAGLARLRMEGAEPRKE